MKSDSRSAECKSGEADVCIAIAGDSCSTTNNDGGNAIANNTKKGGASIAISGKGGIKEVSEGKSGPGGGTLRGAEQEEAGPSGNATADSCNPGGGGDSFAFCPNAAATKNKGANGGNAKAKTSGGNSCARAEGGSGGVPTEHPEEQGGSGGSATAIVGLYDNSPFRSTAYGGESSPGTHGTGGNAVSGPITGPNNEWHSKNEPGKELKNR